MKTLIMLFLLSPCVFGSWSAHASMPPPLITGPSPVSVGQSATYYYDDGLLYLDPVWSVTNGAIQSQTLNGTLYEVVIQWSSTGSGVITLTYDDDLLLANKIVTVNSSCSAPSNPSVTFSISSSACPPRTLSYTGTPGSGITWYWQTSSTGTSTTNSTNSYSVTANGTYYVRAFNTSTGCWSTSSASYAATVTTPPATPSAPSVSTNSCGAKTITRGTPPSGVTWYWQGTDPNGTSTSSSGSAYTANVSGIYYLRARNNSTLCWSLSSRSVSVSILPALPTVTVSSNTCGTITIARETPPTGVVWYWQGTTALGTSTTNSASTYNVTSTGTYYIRARITSTSCWSPTATAIPIIYQAEPATPAAFTISSNTCGDKTLTKPTAPGGVTFFWQGTNAGGTDYTSPIATASTFTATVYGAYYLRARNNTTGCWSTVSYGTTVNVDKPATPVGASYTFCEIEPMTMTLSPISGGFTNINWYDASGTQLLYTGLIYTPTLTSGVHTFRVRELSFQNCESTGYGVITVTVPDNCDDKINWTETTGYSIDASGNPVAVSASKSYSDGFGNPLQSQSKSFANNMVLASQPVYDRFGNAAISTLPAPINLASFAYKHKFVTNSAGVKYSANDFDLPGQPNNPVPVGNATPGTLGWYYSTNNNLEPKTPVTSFPYSRSYTPEGPDPLTSKSAGPGDQHKMGSGHEVVSDKALITTGELNHYYSIRAHFISGGGTNPNKGYKYISTDPNGKQAVSFVDADGNSLASATKNGTTYDNWSYTFYNTTGQVVASVAPNGVNTASTAYPTFVTLYKYDHLGRLIETTATDDGTTQYVYSLDGKIRFSQNQEQRNASPKRFSYTNYDYLGRLVESGEYTQSGVTPFVFDPHTTTSPGPTSVLNPSTLEAIGHTAVSRKLDAVRCTDYTYVEHDKQASDLPTGDVNHPAQTFTYGQVTKTENANAKTWYSYDEFGQLVWSKQDITGLGIKTIDYTYDFLGNVTEVAYQKGSADDFYHHYVYNADQQLTEVWTSLDGTTKTLRAKYYYYLHGPLKRVELASNVQGMDFVYTINGALKTINNTDAANDPGNDGANGFAPDVFGQTMHYYANDYTGANYDAGSQTFSGYADQFGGALKGVTWHTPVDNNMKMNSYAFTYDNLYQFNEAKFGSSTLGDFVPDATDAYKENVSSYDKNGNIQSLVRNGMAGATLGNYGYVYETNTNKLDTIKHNNTPLVEYSYNAIGQMTQQVEGSQTMKVAYNAYGITKEVRNATNQLMVSYAYDDRGDLIKRVDYTNGTAAKNTFYVHDASGNTIAIYEQLLPSGSITLIEVPVYGSGRVAVFKPLVNTYFYEIGDHLGNVRAVIGTTETDVHTATMESENAGNEIPPFKNVNETRVVSVAANHTTGGNEAVRLNNTKPAGPAISLAVSPGDVLDLETWAYYEAGSNYDNTLNSSSMIAAIAAAFGGVSGGAGEAGEIFNSINNALGAGALGLGGTGDPDLPGAYLCYMVFDVNKNYTGQGGYTRVTENGNMAKELIGIPEIIIEHPGYIYICVYNRSDSPNWVYFDDMKVTHEHSPVVAGADFFPFGLTMEGREITVEDYRYGYQGQYAEKDSVTGWNQFQLRMYDARFGRWLSVDPYGQYYSPYMAMNNTPQMSVDRNGGWSSLASFGVGFAVGSIASSWIARENGANMGQTFLIGLAGGIAGGFAGAFINNIGSFPEIDLSKVMPIAVGATRNTVSILVNNSRSKRNLKSILKSDGGRLGGHVAIVADDRVIGFTSDKDNIIESGINSDNDGDGYNRFGIRPETWHSKGKITDDHVAGYPTNAADSRFDIPVSDEQMALIKNEIEKIKLNPPNYGTLHERCTSVAARILRAGKVIKKGSRAFQESPFQFRRYLNKTLQQYKVY